MMNNQSIPITERSNPKTNNIDILTLPDILSAMSDCEEEIYGGYDEYKGVFDEEFIKNCVSFVYEIQNEIHKRERVNVILLGAGTSGRLCRFMAKVLNPHVSKKINLIPVIAGGIKALVRAEPNTEDKLESGAMDYLDYTKDLDRSKCFVIGVTCGLSANYVKGALDEANKYSEGKTAIIGFNPLTQKTIDIDDKISVLNPIIGPEPIMGSVRMKGGTTTMILIYALITSTLLIPNQVEDGFISILGKTRKILRSIRRYHTEIEPIIKSGQTALLSGRSIYLLGLSNYGALCIFDAAECPPTFGARIDQVNGYTTNGVSDLVYYPFEAGEIMAKEISINEFLENKLLTLTENDMVIIIQNDGENIDFVDTISKNKQTNLYLMHMRKTFSDLKTSKDDIVFDEKWDNDFYKLLFIRSILLRISTGSFVLSGKVYENKMIDLRITNKKLFLRAIRIVSDITHKDKSTIEEAIMKCIYEGEIPPQNNLEDHISLSASKENIVPLTILSLVYPNKLVSELKSMLITEPIVRKLVIKELGNLK